MDLNLVVLAGRLAAPPELRVFSGGSRLLRYLVTIRRDEPRRRVDVVPVTLWDPNDDQVTRLPGKGDRVWVAGSVQRRFWESPEGRRSRLEVIADQVQVRDPDRAAEPDPAAVVPEG
jgi:single-strand DNA-binding protein